MKIKKMCRLMLFGKLWRWGWEEIFLEPLMHNSVFCRLPSCYFFCCVIMLSFNCDRNHCKMKIVFLNFYNIRTYNFNLAKSLRNNCNEVSFLLKDNSLKGTFQRITNSIRKILPTIFQRYCSLLTTLILSTCFSPELWQ